MENVLRSRLKLYITLGFETFCLFSFCYFLFNGKGDRLLLCAVTTLLVWLPLVIEKLLRCRFTLPAFLFAMAYAIGPMLGHSYKLYYILPWWDSLLHFAAGVALAMAGCFILRQALSSKPHIWLQGLFGICFALALSVVWEFFEYMMDTFFAMDMQNDTLVYALNSYLLGEGLGELGHISGIVQVTVNGIPLPFSGYLDTGLIDTMTDLLMAFAGSSLYGLTFLLNRGKRPGMLPQAPKKEG